MILAAVFLGVSDLALLVLVYKLQKLMHEERRSTQLERTNLLQRIQAPEIAVVSHANEGQPFDPPAVSLDDDQDHWDWVRKAEELMVQERMNGS